MSLKDDLMESFDDGPACLVQGCDFRVASDDDWHENLEQHVRWLHVRTGDFGVNPIPALFGLLANGLIRPDEFATFVRDVIQAEIDRVDAPVPSSRFQRARWFFAVACFAGLAGFGANVALVTSAAVGGWSAAFRLVISLSLSTCVVMVYWTSLLLLPRGGDVRIEMYPDTTVDDVDGEEKE